MSMPFAAPPAYRGGVEAPAAAGPSLWFLFRGTDLLVAAAEPARIPHCALPDEVGLTAIRTQYLGVLGESHCFAAEAPAGADAPPGWTWQGLRPLFGVLEDSLFALAGRALQIVDWDRSHRFCGACGTPTEPRTTERSRECPACGLVVYPRLAPAVMALVRRGSRELLLARSPRFPKDMYSALAGFVEPGETLEQCLEREVREETCIRVGGARYFASQPWPFPHSLMIAFLADYESGEVQPDAIEIEDARWFDIEKLPRLPARISIARRLIDAAVGEMLAAR